MFRAKQVGKNPRSAENGANFSGMDRAQPAQEQSRMFRAQLRGSMALSGVAHRQLARFGFRSMQDLDGVNRHA